MHFQEATDSLVSACLKDINVKINTSLSKSVNYSPKRKIAGEIRAEKLKVAFLEYFT